MNGPRTKPPDLDAIRARAEAASVGPWTTHRVDEYDHLGVAMNRGAGWVEWVAEECIQRPEDAEFIAHAREDIPALLAEIERLRAIAALADDLRLWNPRGFGDERKGYEAAAERLRAALAAQESAE